MFLRNISIDDAPLLANIYSRCFQEKWSTSAFANMLLNKTYFGSIIEERLSHNEISPVETTNNLESSANIGAGFILCKQILDEVEIITICILSEYRKVGLAKKLMHHLIESLPAATKIFLEVAVGNVDAVNLYTSFGFQEISRRKEYYTTACGSIDAIVMTLTLR
jgi:ribosomal-protein-alanine N-acetyltransferase